MLTSFRLQNFKAWQDTGPVRLAPITVLFGVNSAGKTSLLQFLLMLKQTADSPDRRRVLNAGDAYSPVDLGTFQDLIFEHDLKKHLTFDVSWDLPKPIRFADRVNRKVFSGDSIDFSASIASSKDNQFVEWLEYSLRQDQKEVLSIKLSQQVARQQSQPRVHSKSAHYKLTSSQYKFVRTPGRAWPLPEPTRFYGFPDEVAGRYQNAAFTTELVLSLEQQLKKLLYLGPIRKTANRIYPWAGDSPEHVGTDGGDAIAALLAGEDRSISRGPNKKAYSLQVVVARWLKQLGLLQSFKTKRIADNRKEYEVRVQTTGSRKEVDLPDVGFGISQVLPVVVEAFYVQPGSTIIIEQPELHLHPRVQAELADLFIEAVSSRQDGADRSIQFLIESHSEHFLQRLQLRIAEGSISPESVALYFCEPGSEGSILRELDVNMFGDIGNWPTDFFGDPMADLAARMEAVARREEQQVG